MSGIYIHIPFCKQACHYCNFHFSTSLKNKDKLIDCIIKEIHKRAKDWKNEIFETIYFGGGTPSILPAKDIISILEVIKENFVIADNPEITLEANPDDLTPEKLKIYAQIGINRMSIGIQSFDDENLIKLNRSHTGKQAKQSILYAQKTGIENISIDLIYGIPGLTDNKWIENIEIALDLQVPHISAYALTVEPKTALAWKISKGKYPPVSDRQAARQFEILRKILTENGFEHYEISNFGKKGFWSKHNTGYWTGKKYLGLGPAAHSYTGKIRRWNLANNALYIKNLDANNYFEEEILTKENMVNELIMIGLRSVFGVNLNTIKEIAPEYYDSLLQTAKTYIENKQLILDSDILKSEPKSWFIIEGIISDLFIV